MKKIAIVTINDYSNLGNRLQNYAMQNVLSLYGDVVTLEKNEHEVHKLFTFRKLISFFYHLPKRVVKKILRWDKRKQVVSPYFDDRHHNFLEFNDDFVHFGLEITKKNGKEINKAYDYFVAGSDQIWNPNFQPNQYITFLRFADELKRIAVSPSISISEFKGNFKQGIKEGASGFKYISCREKQGSELLTSLTGKPCATLLDPTLMLSSTEWDKVSKKPTFHDENKKYILLYFLGELTEEYKNIINNISSKYNLEVINIYDKNNIYYTCGPSEFVYLISHCSIMLTDSFHGSVFSYIYNKPFRIFERINGMNMNSRLTNLIDILHLDNLFINKDTNIDNILETHYDRSYLEKEQKKFKDYLDMCFKEE